MIFPEELSKCDKKQKVIVSAENRRKHIAFNNESCKVFQYRIDGEIDRDLFTQMVTSYFFKNKDVETHFNELNNKL